MVGHTIKTRNRVLKKIPRGYLIFDGARNKHQATQMVRGLPPIYNARIIRARGDNIFPYHIATKRGVD